RAAVSGSPVETHYEVRVGADLDAFNYTDSAQAESVSWAARWNQRWSSLIASSYYQRFAETANKASISTAYRFTSRDWLNAGGAFAHDQGIIPRREAFFEYGHGFQLPSPYIRGWETSYQQRWLWYRDAQVLTLTGTALAYLPRSWSWSVALTGAHSQFNP